MWFSPGQRITTYTDGAMLEGTIVRQVTMPTFKGYCGDPVDVRYYLVKFDHADEFIRMSETYLKPYGEKWMPQCECGNMWRICHPDL